MTERSLKSFFLKQSILFWKCLDDWHLSWASRRPTYIWASVSATPFLWFPDRENVAATA